jgi:glycosyltransferase involved in cell wall biosynthesis
MEKKSIAYFDFTVFTPTFNRCHTLSRAYESLKLAGEVKLEWLVIDDGSKDSTGDLINDLSKNSPFPIVYIYQYNQGKHVAHNQALKHARGKFFVVLDSDDELYPSALSELLQSWNEVNEAEKDRIAGILGNSVDERGAIVGSPFPIDLIDGVHFYLHAAGLMVGDKLPCYRLDVLRKYPFPEPVTQTVVPESVVWHSIGRSHMVRCRNVIVRRYNKAENDKYSLMNSYSTPASNAHGKLIYTASTLDWSSPYFFRFPLFFIKLAINFTRFSLHSGESPLANIKINFSKLNKLIIYLATPIGYLVWAFDVNVKSKKFKFL